ncbi:MAG: hypothetical protein ABI835_13845 [Chloroflexota bacterium]
MPGLKGTTMHLPVILAHGALGPYDELIMLGAASIFLVIMGISWVKNRNTRPEFEEAQSETQEPRELSETATDSPDAPDRFRLD